MAPENPWLCGCVAGSAAIRLAAVGELAPESHAKREIDAKGRIVAHGFMKLGQSDVSLLIDNVR